MKRIVAVLLVLLAATALFASTEFTFSGTYALIGANGRTIRKTKAEVNDGLFIATGKAPASAMAEKYTVFMGENSLVAVTETEDLTIFYLIYGNASVVVNVKLSTPIAIYTPTTLTQVSAKGEYCILSTDNDEIFYNFSAHGLKSYDAIRGANVTISATKGFDFIHNKSVPLDERYRMSAEEMEEIVRIPAAPIFTSPLQKVIESIPQKPQFADVLQNLEGTPEKPVFESVSEELIKTPNAPSFADAKQEIVETPVRPVAIIVTQVLEDDTTL